jgi:arginyl-tRNA synthetase
MVKAKEFWKTLIHDELVRLAEEKHIDPAGIGPGTVVTENPPRPELGDLAFPLFPFARVFRTAPQALAETLAERLAARPEAAGAGTVRREGPYLNIAFDRPSLIAEILDEVESRADRYGFTGTLSGRKVMVEFSCPNTNKPLHLGHMRNDSIGESVSRILAAAGGEVMKVNLINDRGIHICKSMLAYRKFGGGRTPEEEGLKSDHFVGKYYVKFNEWVKEDPTAEEQARAMLRAWEAGDPETVELWKKMNGWAISGIQETYRATGISFDRYYFESETYLSGREEILKGLERGIFYREQDGSVWVDLAEIGLDKKVLLRSDGTSLYLTQDIGTAIARHRDWPFDRLIYVVASEQQYHFKVLFHVLRKLGLEWADQLYHLSYGMVNLPEGKMKSREGTVVDADDLMAELTRLAAEEIRAKGREEEVGDVEGTAKKVALAALNYYLLQVSPVKDMVFNPAESISFTGNTGPYLQYMGARISSMVRKAEERAAELAGVPFRPELLAVPEEWELAKLVSAYPEVVDEAAGALSPAAVANYLYDVAKVFSRYYHDNPILQAPEPELVAARMRLVRAVVRVFRNAFHLIGVPFLEKM